MSVDDQKIPTVAKLMDAVPSAGASGEAAGADKERIAAARSQLDSVRSRLTSQSHNPAAKRALGELPNDVTTAMQADQVQAAAEVATAAEAAEVKEVAVGGGMLLAGMAGMFSGLVDEKTKASFGRMVSASDKALTVVSASFGELFNPAVVSNGLAATANGIRQAAGRTA